MSGDAIPPPNLHPAGSGWTLALGAATLIGLALRLFRLDHFSYGLDEILQVYWIKGSWAFLWKSIRFDAVHPPLDYVIGRALEPLHPADWARKLTDVLWGTATIPAIGLLLRRRAGESAGAIAALLLALAPFHVRYSQELRPYALALFLLSLALLSLDRYLERPGLTRIVVLYAASLATAYALYFAAVVLALAAFAMLAEDALGADPSRRSAARRFLLTSPLFCAALAAAYLPWWPVVLEASRRPPIAARAPVTLARADRVFSFFLFAPDGGHPLQTPGTLYLLVVLFGAVVAAARDRLRFLLAWAFGGIAVIEILGQIHPHYDAVRRFLPGGLGLIPLAAVALGGLWERKRWRLVALLVAFGIAAGDLRSLGTYFREGRADWRTLGRAVRALPPGEPVFTENPYSQLCTAFYGVGERWLYEQMTRGTAKIGRPILNLEGEIPRLTWSWAPGTRAWLVLAGNPVHPALRAWAGQFPTTSYPAAERAVLVRLEPALREQALAGR
ncbi:MAG: glycosyltransferase family 39 protein [Acidobacteriota bacterium]